MQHRLAFQTLRLRSAYSMIGQRKARQMILILDCDEKDAPVTEQMHL